MRRSDEPGQPTRPNRLYWTAMIALGVMAVLNFAFWLDGAVEPVIFGLPIVFTYHALYVIPTVGVLWLVFKAVWPSEKDGNPDDVAAGG
ncbi:MAG: hypothetical protein GEU81_04545 [Nitriliruptorales bacterium]|nr:hypothetical protein [Nitriliruptorales bacterium]